MFEVDLTPAPPASVVTRTWRYTPAVWFGGLTLAWLAVFAACLARPVPGDQITPRPIGDRIRINQDDAVTLQLLPGIGPALAENVIAYRGAEGVFTRVRELEAVHRIGPRTRERITPLITLDTYPPASADPAERAVE